MTRIQSDAATSIALRAAHARRALEDGDFVMAHKLAQGLVATAPEAAEGHFLLAMVEASAGRLVPAVDLVRRAIALEPRGDYLAQLARLLITLRRDGEAAEALQRAEMSPPADALSRDTIGCVYARLGDHAASVPHFAAAVAQAPDNPEFRYNLAAALNFVGRVDEAETALEALIAMRPGEGRAHHLLASLRKQTPAANHITRLQDTLDQATNRRDRLLIGYALMKELEDTGARDRAFAQLAATNAEHRAALAYDPQSDAANVAAIMQHWPPPSSTRPLAADAGPAPIFVIGMPRTGTTLVDRILSSHPDVESAGELQAMPLAVKLAAATRSRVVLDPETIAAAARVDPAGIGRDYLARAAHHHRRGAPRFVDKFPGNFHYVGMIARALPNARIVCLRRHPLDTVLSNFRNLFAISSRYYDYSYDLLDIARYYAGFDKLMAFWREVLPGRVLEIDYEALVADQEGQTRALLTHCGLPWSDACLDFHTNAAPVSTPSAAQVRQPIYRDAVARWKHHAADLAPAAQWLKRAGIALA